MPLVEGEIQRALDALPGRVPAGRRPLRRRGVLLRGDRPDHGLPHRHRDEPPAPRAKAPAASALQPRARARHREGRGAASASEPTGRRSAERRRRTWPSTAPGSEVRHDRATTVATARGCSASYLDGELEAAKLIEIDEHVGECETCREEAQLLRAMRGSLKRVVRTAAPAGPARAHRRRDDGRADARGRARDADVDALGREGAAGEPVVVADDGAARDGGGARARVGRGDARRRRRASTEARAGFGDDLLAELVAEHSQPLPPEAKDPEAVRGLERYVGVPVRPASFERGRRAPGRRRASCPCSRSARRCSSTSSARATDTRRVSVIVYDAQKIQIGDGEPRAARGRHRRGARGPREGLLGRGDAARRASATWSRATSIRTEAPSSPRSSTTTADA